MKITVGSDLHKAFHEAGHIVVGILTSATVTAALIDADGNCLTSITHKPDLSTKKPIACGGYAAECLLFQSSVLLDSRGVTLSKDAFELQAMENARLDKFPYYLTKPADASGIFPDTLFQPNKDKSWPPDSDGAFCEYAMKEIFPLLTAHRDAIETLISELERERTLSGEDILEIWRNMS